ncbi:uncharacterized protein LOC116127972 isoform X2 [Pistacia vera]|uniref:uncharacterized protein LOC116127972 isoform X2 n=1 Tax=Pistacia vera TaxID=55513 RepID=UPI001262AD10|nr:uncharacterized protein LOC116127972 isoform X2 [Pistacia vera]
MEEGMSQPLVLFHSSVTGFELLFNPKKRALAALFAILEAISFYLDRFVESRLSIRIVACLLSVLGLLVIVWTLFMERNSMANRVVAKKVLWALEIGFGVAQLINSFMILVGSNIMNKYMSSILLLFFVVISYGSTFITDEEGSDTYGLENSISSIEFLRNPNEIDERSDLSNTPNEIGEHSDLANTSNKISSPFIFPRRKRSVRPRLYLSIDSDSE